jgi:hypothetical protein
MSKTIKNKENFIKLNKTKRVKEKLKKQSKNRQNIINEFRNRNNKFGYIISHGYFDNSSDLFTIPYNIRLIQYTNPGSLLYPVDAYYIMKQLSYVKNGKVVKYDTLNKLYPPPILIEKSTNIAYFPHQGLLNHFLVIEPNTETTNLKLSFDRNHAVVTELFDMHIGLPNGKIVYPHKKQNIEINTDLKVVLNFISNKYEIYCKKNNITNPDPLNVIQISCKPGKYNDLQNLTHQFENLNIKSFECLTTNQIDNDYIPTSNFLQWVEDSFTPLYISYKNMEELNNLKKKYCIDESDSNKMDISP